jgi:hypothetical protein
MKNRELFYWAIVDAFGIFVYVSLVSFVMFNAQYILDNGKPDDFTAPLAALLLFVVSAVITGSLFLGRPAWLFFNGSKKEGIQLFFYTLASLIVITLALLVTRML